MSELRFSDNAWADYLYWQSQDRKTLRKVNLLIQDIQRGGTGGLGKAELLRGNWSGWASRRIDDRNRIIYRFKDGAVEIAACKGHYE